MTPKPPIEFLVDSFEYCEYIDDEGDWNKPRYKKSVTVNNCRIDRTAQFTTVSNGKQLLFNAIVFCYQGLSSSMGPFIEQSLVIYDGQEHTITKAIPITDAYSKELYAYELEVI